LDALAFQPQVFLTGCKELEILQAAGQHFGCCVCAASFLLMWLKEVWIMARR
jgi:hypothetical protein